MIRMLLWFILVLVVTLPPLDPYLDASMTRLVLIQVPGLLLLGILPGPLLGLDRIIKQNWAFATLLLALGMVMFWMVPRSVDLAVADDRMDALMHLTLLVAGYLLRLSLTNLPLLIQMATGIYATAMASSLGIVLNQAQGRICARFTLEEQQTAGEAILWACGLLLILHLVWSLRMLVQNGDSDKA